MRFELRIPRGFVKKLIIVGAALILLCVLIPAPARAGITFSESNTPQAGDANILFGDSTGNPVFGTTNGAGNFSVRFSSTSETSLLANGGQARIESNEGVGELLEQLTIDIPAATFTSLIFNPFDGDPNGGLLTVTVHRLVGSDLTYSYALNNGENYLTIVATAGDRIVSVEMQHAAGFGFNDARQFRIGGAAAVPEPGSIALLGVGALAMAGYRFRRKKK